MVNEITGENEALGLDHKGTNRGARLYSSVCNPRPDTSSACMEGGKLWDHTRYPLGPHHNLYSNNKSCVED